MRSRIMRSRIMRSTITTIFCVVFIASVLDGCGPSGATESAELVKKPVKQMSSQECEQYLMENIGSNARRNDQDMLAIVFPCTPRNLRVYNWRRFKAHQITEEEFKENADRQARTCLGLAYDGDNDQFVDAQGKYVRDFTQIDSILIIITLETRSSGLSPYLRGFFRDQARDDNNALNLFLNPGFSPAASPNISSLKDKIRIEGDNEYLTSPAYVHDGGSRIAGRKGDMFVMVPVTAGMRRYLETHTSVDVKMEVGSEDIVVTVPLWL